jgi:transposase
MTDTIAQASAQVDARVGSDVVVMDDDVVARVCAIDIGKDVLVACVRVPRPALPGRRVQHLRESSTVTPALRALAAWLHTEQIELVAMEATSDYAA